MTEFLSKAIKGLAKGTLALEGIEMTEEGLRICYHRTPKTIKQHDVTAQV